MAPLLAWMLLATVHAEDSVDAVQVTLASVGSKTPGQQTDADACNAKDGFAFSSGKCQMKCNHGTMGFVPNGGDITGLLLSCPVDFPNVRTSGVCAGEKGAESQCRVDPDRSTCCKTVECTCANGKATTHDASDDNKKCTEDGAEDCFECDSGYHLQGGQPAPGNQACKKNVCVCTNGDPLLFDGTGTQQCVTNGAHSCLSCHTGYREETNSENGSITCTPNYCTCSHGTQATADAGRDDHKCIADGIEKCIRCDDGYTLVDGKCKPSVCSTSDINPSESVKYNTAECGTKYTGDSCWVTCANNYVGEKTEFTCTADVGKSSSSFSGTLPDCKPITCTSSASYNPQTANVVSTCTGTLSYGESCTVSCAEGYTGAATEYTCGQSGTLNVNAPECTAMKCSKPVCPEHANCETKCNEEMESGTSCEPECNTGYEPNQSFRCLTGKMTTQGQCIEQTCAADEPPQNGEAGGCTGRLASGSTCAPKCNDGYHLDPSHSTCDKGRLTQVAQCVTDLKCELVFGKGINQEKGYWTNEANYLNYEGCESFCNQKNEANKAIVACELTPVDSEARSTKSTGHCFAHSNFKSSSYAVTIEDKTNNAAAKCTYYGQ